MADLLTLDRVRQELKRACNVAGSQTAWAADNDLSTAYVNDVIHGRRDPGDSVLSALGFERVTLYRKKASK